MCLSITSSCVLFHGDSLARKASFGVSERFRAVHFSSDDALEKCNAE